MSLKKSHSPISQKSPPNSNDQINNICFETEDSLKTDNNLASERLSKVSIATKKEESEKNLILLNFTSKTSQKDAESDKNVIESVIYLTKPKKKWENYIQNALIFLKCYLFPHAIAASFTLIMLFAQTKFNKGCFLPPNCTCDNNIGLKIFDSIKDFIFFYMFLLLTSVNNDFIEHRIAKLGLILIVLMFLVCYYIIVDENTISDIYIYIFLFLAKISLEYYYLRKSKRNDIKKCLFKLNIVYIVIYSNYIFYSFFLVNMREYFQSHDNEYGKTLAQFIISAYTIVLTYLLEKVHLIYADLVYSKNEHNKIAIFLSSTMMLCYVFAIPASYLLHMNIGNIATYFWMISYCNVLSTSFLHINIVRYSFWKLKNFIMEKCCKGKKEIYLIKIENNQKILDTVAKSSLDMLFVTSFRPIILFYCGKWLAKYGNAKLFKNCQYDFNEDYFFIEPFGLFSIVGINFLVVGLICLYSLVSKKKIIHYRNNFSLFNLYILILMHIFYEATLTVFY